MCPQKIGEHIVAQQAIWIPRWVNLKVSHNEVENNNISTH